MWKYSTTWEKKTLKIGLSTSNPYPNLFVYPDFTLFLWEISPLFPLASSISFHSFLGPMSSPCHIVSCYTSSPYMVPMAFCSSARCSVLHLILALSVHPSFFLTLVPRWNTHSFSCLSELHLHLPPLLPVWLLLSNQASSSLSCLVLAKGGGWSLDREVPFSAQSPVQARPICLDQQVQQRTC